MNYKMEKQDLIEKAESVLEIKPFIITGKAKTINLSDLKKQIRKITKGIYEAHLNEHSPEHNSEDWIIGGTYRTFHAQNKTYGTALRYFDPIEFEHKYKLFMRSYENLLT